MEDKQTTVPFSLGTFTLWVVMLHIIHEGFNCIDGHEKMAGHRIRRENVDWKMKTKDKPKWRWAKKLLA